MEQSGPLGRKKLRQTRLKKPAKNITLNYDLHAGGDPRDRSTSPPKYLIPKIFIFRRGLIVIRRDSEKEDERTSGWHVSAGVSCYSRKGSQREERAGGGGRGRGGARSAGRMKSIIHPNWPGKKS